MMYVEQNSQKFSGLFPSSGIPKKKKTKNTTFRKLDLFPSSGEGGEKTPTQLGPLERANLNHWAQLSRCLLPHLHLRTETDPVSETSCFLEYRTMEEVQKNSVNSVLHFSYQHEVITGTHKVDMKYRNKEFCKKLIAYFPFIWHGSQRKRKKKNWGTPRQQGVVISIVTKIKGIHRQIAR
jgi:hypothetical protein